MVWWIAGESADSWGLSWTMCLLLAFWTLGSALSIRHPVFLSSVFAPTLHILPPHFLPKALWYRPLWVYVNFSKPLTSALLLIAQASTRLNSLKLLKSYLRLSHLCSCDCLLLSWLRCDLKWNVLLHPVWNPWLLLPLRIGSARKDGSMVWHGVRELHINWEVLFNMLGEEVSQCISPWHHHYKRCLSQLVAHLARGTVGIKWCCFQHLSGIAGSSLGLVSNP